jgi:hypothetical protein
MKPGTKKEGEADGGSGVRRGFGLALAMIALIPAFARSQPDLKFRVRVYDYTPLPPGTLAAAEAEARRIFNATGVDLVWLACFEVGGQSRSGSNQDCAGQFEGTTVVLRILPSSPPAKAAVPDVSFGVAVGSSVASVFYGRITDLTHDFRGDDSEVPVFLGIAITHELGHLLLGQASHSPTGVMCASWDWSRLHSALTGHVFFTAQQSKQIRKEVLARTITQQCQLASVGKLEPDEP